jgi:hypothetical protein
MNLVIICFPENANSCIYFSVINLHGIIFWYVKLAQIGLIIYLILLMEPNNCHNRFLILHTSCNQRYVGASRCNEDFILLALGYSILSHLTIKINRYASCDIDQS